MDRSQRKNMALFREVFDVTEILTDAQFGELIRAVAAYHFGMEAVPVEDPAVDMALGFICAQVDRYEEHCGKNREAAKARYRKKHTTEEAQESETPEAENAAPEGTAKCSEIQQNAAQATEAPQGAAKSSEMQRNAAKCSEGTLHIHIHFHIHIHVHIHVHIHIHIHIHIHVHVPFGSQAFRQTASGGTHKITK